MSCQWSATPRPRNDALVAAAVGKWGRLDTMVANAGI
jgi:hypothetical protein